MQGEDPVGQGGDRICTQGDKEDTEEPNSADTLISAFHPPGPQDNPRLLCEPLSPWHFVRAALGNSYTRTTHVSYR